MIIVPTLSLPDPDHPRSDGSRDPHDLIHVWERAGFQRAQLIEPALRDDRPRNRHETEELLRDLRIDIQVAGEIASADDVEALVECGATSVVLGSRALDEPEWLESTAAAFPDLLIVESSARERRVRSRGWVRTLVVDVRDLGDELSTLPLAGLLITFPDDAVIDHGDLALIEDLAEQVPFPLMVGGGAQTLASLRDLEFRGVSATLIGALRLGDTFDDQMLARTFVEWG
jgi:phosphoribosylformimino-5-aminoimidazole carboxamide ribonucleotide (ProFAR) isomerase